MSQSLPVHKPMSDVSPEQMDVDRLVLDFIAALEQLQAQVGKSTVDGRSLQQDFLAVQQFYQQSLLPTLMDAPHASDLVTHQTEINRAFRLLGMDVTFLRSAKNAITQQQRQAQMQQRLKTLLEFTGGLRDQLANKSTGAADNLPDSGQGE